jgi:uncharacterized protein
VTATAAPLLLRGSDAVLLRVRVTPRSAVDAVTGVAASAGGQAVQIRVRAVPADGAANTALVRTLATWLDVAPTTIGVVTGLGHRLKTVRIKGDPALLETRILERLARQDKRP